MGFTQEQVELLEQQINSDHVSTRKGAGGMELSYIETHHAINTANRVFGYDGWSYEICDLNSRVYENESVVIVKTTAQVKVEVDVPENERENDEKLATLRTIDSGASLSRKDVGHGDSKSKNGLPDFELAEKEAVSDALKRALRSFGNQFGNSLYDKEFLKTLDNSSGSSGPRKSNTSSGNGGSKLASDKQKKFLSSLLDENSKKLSDFTDKTMDSITSFDASKIIKELQ